MLFLFITTLQLFRPGLGASAGDLNLRSRNKGSSTMVLPVRRRLRTKTPPTAETAPSIPQGSGGGLGPQSPGGGDPPAGGAVLPETEMMEMMEVTQEEMTTRLP